MNTDATKFSLSELQIDAYIAELGSEQAQIRQAAIAQLQQFIDNEKVIKALDKHKLIEANPECSRDLELVLKLARSSSVPVELTKNQTYSPAEIIRLWFSEEAAHLFSLTRHIRKMPKNAQIQIFCEIIDQSPEPARILPALDFSPQAMLDDTVLDRLERVLSSDSALLKMRATSLLTRIKPVKLIKHLPGLLMHQNIQVRLLAIKALHLLSKSEAVRLLNELMSSSNLGRQMSAIAFLFVLPFEDTSDILVRLIESGNLPLNIDQAIRYLIYNNPDSKFFKRLTISWLLHGRRIAALKSYWHLAAHSLVVAGLTQKSQQELIDESLVSAREFISRHSPHREYEQHVVSSEISTALKNQDLTTLVTLKKFDAANEEILLNLTRKLETTSEIVTAVTLIGRHKLSSTPICDWLESLVEHKDPEIVRLVVETLHQTKKSRLIAHLPILVFHDDASVAESSLKIFAASSPDKFIEKLKIWMKDSNDKTREIASKGLLEIDFLQALDLLIAFFRTCKKPDLIKYYSPVLLLNPARLSVYKLTNLAGKTTGEKQRTLNEIADTINAELAELGSENRLSGISSLISEANLRDQWLIILEKIQKITYENQSLNLGEFIQTKAVNIALSLILLLAILVVLVRFEFSSIPAKPAPAVQPETVYSFDLGQGPVAEIDDKVASPWDYQLPGLATPPKGLYQVFSLEEVTAVYEQMLLEAGTSARELPPDEKIIRLEAEFNR